MLNAQAGRHDELIWVGDSGAKVPWVDGIYPISVARRQTVFARRDLVQAYAREGAFVRVWKLDVYEDLIMSGDLGKIASTPNP